MGGVAAGRADTAGLQPRCLDFRTIVAMAVEHRLEVEQRCLPCSLGALRLRTFSLTRGNRRVALPEAYAYRRARPHDSSTRDCCTRCALDGLGSADPATRTTLTALLNL